MRQVIAAVCLFLSLSAIATADEPRPIEKAFEHTRPHLKVVSAAMKAEGDQGIDVYLKGGDIVCLNYLAARANTTTRRQFFFDKGAPALAVETISDLRDEKGEMRNEPKVRSVERYDITPAAHGAKTSELRDHCQELLKYYRGHRKDFAEEGGGD
jgi:hypothetical protein